MDKLLLQVGQTVILLWQMSCLLGGLLSLGIQDLLDLLIEGSKVLNLLLQAYHLLLSVPLLLFDGGLFAPQFLRGQAVCGQSLPKLLHGLL